jgi:thiamine biosynthesis protein ThiS
MKVVLNGEAIDCDDGITVERLINLHGLSPETTLAERNGVALHRREWARERLQPNDRLEILQLAAGG